ncbi:unnamed protein product, partial [Urochloa humidicola]
EGRHGGGAHCLANEGEGGAASPARKGTTVQPRQRRLQGGMDLLCDEVPRQGRSNMRLPRHGESEAL